MIEKSETLLCRLECRETHREVMCLTLHDDPTRRTRMPTHKDFGDCVSVDRDWEKKK